MKKVTAFHVTCSTGSKVVNQTHLDKS